MKIFISGYPGCGKTTLIKKIIEDFGKDKFYGFYTEEIRENNSRVGFKIITTWGEEKILASIKERSNYKVGKYFVLKDNIDYISIKFIQNLDKNKILVIDEIGKMEMISEYFNQILNFIRNNDLNLIATVHRNYFYLFNDYIWLSRENWDDIYNKVKNMIKKILIFFD